MNTRFAPIVRLEMSCSECTGFVIGKNKILTAAHCFESPTDKIEAVFVDGKTSLLKLVKKGAEEPKDNDIALLEGDTYDVPPLEIVAGCPLPQRCGSFGYGGASNNQKGVRCFGGRPRYDGLWLFEGDIDYGDSGGPVLDLQDRVIGMQVRLASSDHEFLAIPSCRLLEFLK